MAQGWEGVRARGPGLGMYGWLVFALTFVAWFSRLTNQSATYQFYSHIVLSGGSTMYPGLPSRLEKDLTDLYLKKVLDNDKKGLKVSHDKNSQ